MGNNEDKENISEAATRLHTMQNDASKATAKHAKNIGDHSDHSAADGLGVVPRRLW